MFISKQDRKDYEEGLRDRKKSATDQIGIDMFANHPGSDAYYKGRKGEQPDEDKKKK